MILNGCNKVQHNKLYFVLCTLIKLYYVALMWFTGWFHNIWDNPGKVKVLR